MTTIKSSLSQQELNSIYQQSPQQPLTQVIESILYEHLLVRKLIPESQEPVALMKAISDQLYFTSLNYHHIQEKCVSYAKQLLESNAVPSKLKTLYTEIENYLKDPSNPQYDNINLELVSLVFKKKVVAYSISKELVLKSFLFNNRHEDTIQIINLSGHYDSVYSEKILNNHLFCQTLVYSFIGFKSKEENEFKNIDYENHLDEITKSAADNEEVHQKNIFSFSSSESARSPIRKQISQEKQEGVDGQQGVYHLFQYSEPPADIFNQIFFSERKNSIAEQVRKRKSTFSNTSPVQKQEGKSQPILKRGLQKKGQGIKLSAVKDLMKQEIESDRPNNIEGEKSPKQHSQEIESCNAQEKQNNQITNNFLAQREENQLIQETSDIELLKSKANSNNRQDHQNLSKSEQASFQGFSSSNGLAYSSINNQNQNQQNHIIIQTQANQSLTSATQDEIGNIINLDNNQLSPSSQQIYQYKQGEVNSYLNQPENSYLEQQRKKAIENGGEKKFTGMLKFFDFDKNYGFIVEEDSKQDIFVHLDDLQKAGIPKTCLYDHKHGKTVRFQFGKMTYFGKYKQSIKAIEIQLLSDTPPFLPLTPLQLRMLPSEQYLQYPSYYPPGVAQIIHPGTSQPSPDHMQTSYYQAPYNPAFMPPGGILQQSGTHLVPLQSSITQSPPQNSLQYPSTIHPYTVPQLSYQNIQLPPSSPSTLQQLYIGTQPVYYN